MVLATYRLYELPWTRLADDQGRLKKITTIVLLVCFILGVVIPWIPVPEQERKQAEQLPPRLAQLLLEKKQPPPPPPPKVEPKEEKPKEEPKPKEEKPKEEPKPKEKPKVDKTEEARKKAATSGLLAFADDLADLRDEPVVSALDTKNLNKGTATAKTVTRNVLTSGNKGSGGISTANISRGIGGTTALEARGTTQVESSVKVVAKTAPDPAQATAARHTRTYEEVSLVLEKNKGAIYSLYNRALRKNPTLQGKVVLELTIDPAGSVTNCTIVSSELNDTDLERKLVARVKLLKFGSRDVDVLVVTYPIDFLPS